MDVEIKHKHNQLVIHHQEEQELKQETMAVPACYVPVCLKKKHNARKAVWFTKATVHWSNFCIFVDSIDSQIILPMIRESKMENVPVPPCTVLLLVPLVRVKSVQSALSDLLTTSATYGTFSRPSTKHGLILIGLELNLLPMPGSRLNIADHLH